MIPENLLSLTPNIQIQLFTHVLLLIIPSSPNLHYYPSFIPGKILLYSQRIKLPIPIATRLANAARNHRALPLVSVPLVPALFVGVVVAAEEVDEPVLAAWVGPMLPP